MKAPHPIAVLAGTPVDTRMGVEVLERRGLSAAAFPLARDPRQQTAFQISSRERKEEVLFRLLEDLRRQGYEKAFVYCNSLSSAVDFTPLAERTGLRIVTPLEVYRGLAHQYRCLGLIAANAQGLSGIERTLLAANPGLDLLGACALGAVLSIEAGEDPGALVDHHHLDLLADWFRRCGAQALILGCTHFPYFQEALSRRTSLPLIDPAEEMVALLER